VPAVTQKPKTDSRKSFCTSIGTTYLDASHLSDAAYDFGDQIGRGVLTEEQALEEIKKEYPNFSEATYRDFLSYGFFIGR
jgi:hypothetical protein